MYTVDFIKLQTLGYGNLHEQSDHSNKREINGMFTYLDTAPRIIDTFNGAHNPLRKYGLKSEKMLLSVKVKLEWYHINFGTILW